MSELTQVFGLMKIVIAVVFVAAFFFMVYRGLKIDLIGEWKKRLEKKPSAREVEYRKEKEAYNIGYREGVRAKTMCDNPNCISIAGDNGALVLYGDMRRIVCRECLQPHLDTGWTLQFEWRDEK
jgi:hypothetical protein